MGENPNIFLGKMPGWAAVIYLHPPKTGHPYPIAPGDGKGCGKHLQHLKPL